MHASSFSSGTSHILVPIAAGTGPVHPLTRGNFSDACTKIPSESRHEPQHITKPFDSGNLPVDAVATVANGPGDESISWRMWQALNDTKITSVEHAFSNPQCCVTHIMKCDNSKVRARIKRITTDRRQRKWEGDRAETTAFIECPSTDSPQCSWEYNGGELDASNHRTHTCSRK